MSSKSTWQRHERATAAMFGVKRNGNTGRNSADCETDAWAVECKSRKDVPLWLQRAIAQAVANAKPGQTPLLVLHPVGGRRVNDLVIMRRSDFEDWLGRLSEPEEASA